MVELVFVEQTCQIDSGEEVTNNTDDPGCSEATDRTGTDHEQDDTCDQRGEVGVEDGREGIAVTLSHRFLHIFTLAQLLLDTLVDKHVGIHGSTQRKHHTGDTTHRQGSLERGQDTKREEHIDDQGTDSDRTRDDVIDGKHEDDQQHESHNEREDTLLDRLCTERWSYNLLLDDMGGSRHTTRLQGVGEILRILDGEVTADGALSTADLTIDTRSRINDTIEDDSDSLAHIGLGQFSPSTGTVRVHRHRDLRLAGQLVELILGIGDHVTL